MRGSPVPRDQRSARTILLLAAGTFMAVVSVLFLGSRLPTKSKPVPAKAPTAEEEGWPTIAPEVLHANWTRDVHAALDGLGTSPSPTELETAKQALLNMRVAAQDKQTHLSLVLSLVAWQHGLPEASKNLATVLRVVGK